MSFKVGDIAVVKTTGEKVFVLSVPESGGIIDPSSSPGDIKLRRPVATREGIMHQISWLTPGELQSIEERMTDEIDQELLEMKLRKQKMESAKELFKELLEKPGPTSPPMLIN